LETTGERGENETPALREKKEGYFNQLFEALVRIPLKNRNLEKGVPFGEKKDSKREKKEA